MAVSFSLSGKVALVTGASQGIGESIAKALAAAGAHVVVAARREDKAAEVARAIGGAGGSAEALRLDVADPASVSAAFKAVVEKHGKLDILVNNAGITDDGLVLRMSKESWDRVIATDLTGVFLCAQEAAKTMLKKRVAGRIVNITSVVGLMGNAGQTNYAAAKAGRRRLHEGARARNRLARNHRQRGRAGLRRDVHDGRPERGAEEGARRPDRPRAARNGRRRRGGRPLPGLGRGRLRDRDDAST